MRVAAVLDETADAKSFRLQPPASLTYRAGQFLTVGVPSERGMAARCYSLSSAPHEDEFTITVKRTRDGFVSNWMCDHVQPGHTLTVLPPSGNFVAPTSDTDVLLFAGGSGITPVISIAKHVLTQSDKSVALFYANRDAESVIFANQLRDLSRAHSARLHVVHWLESLQSLPSADDLRHFAAAHPDHSAYCCGPEPFMAAVAGALRSLGFPADRFRREVFKSLSADPFESADPVTPSEHSAETSRVRGTIDGRSFDYGDWPSGIPLLQFLLSKGVDAPFSCRNGECSACCFRIIEGTVDMTRNDVLDANELGDGYRLACQATPTSDSIVITYD